MTPETRPSPYVLPRIIGHSTSKCVGICRETPKFGERWGLEILVPLNIFRTVKDIHFIFGLYIEKKTRTSHRVTNVEYIFILKSLVSVLQWWQIGQ